MKTNYRKQDGCINCKHKCTVYEFDSEFEYFCNIENNRPLSGSVAMEEHNYIVIRREHPEIERHSKEYYKIRNQNTKKWLKWSKSRKVEPNGICDDYERK
jgi:hypothetical protein